MLALHTRSQCRFTDFLFLVFALNTAAQTSKITAREAKDHIGEVQTVCGKVASTHFASKSKGEPTFLNLDEPYPKEVFTILIWGSDRAKFGARRNIRMRGLGRRAPNADRSDKSIE